MIRKELIINKNELSRYNRMMSWKRPCYDKHGISRYSTISEWTVDFGNGYEVDLKVCSSDTDEPLWCEAVLFLNGSECCCSDVGDSLDGTWGFEYENEEFLLVVKENNNETIH